MLKLEIQQIYTYFLIEHLTDRYHRHILIMSKLKSARKIMTKNSIKQFYTSSCNGEAKVFSRLLHRLGPEVGMNKAPFNLFLCNVISNI